MSEKGLKAPIHKNRQTTMSRISALYSGGLFGSLGLSSKIYGKLKETTHVYYYSILGPHGSWENVTTEEILNGLAQQNEITPGQSFGPTWTTHWFHVIFEGPFPEEFNGNEIHFRWASGTEAMVYELKTDGGGVPYFDVVQGLSPGYREEYIFTKNWENPPQRLEFYVEMACNHMFGNGSGDMIAPPNNDSYWGLQRIDLAVFNRENFNLTVDLEMLNGIASELGDSHIGYQAMFAANQMVNILRENPNDTAEARKVSAAFFNEAPGIKAHTLFAMGHCHIDTAWLWPYDETKRKCARSFSAQLGLMDEYPDYKFVCSSAQQFAWVQQYYPSLFDRIKAKISEGKFFPVGGTWLEMDGNLPSGESFMRQFYYGQKYFKDNFTDVEGNPYVCKEFWLPDTFGYAAQIPQMLKHVGIDRFLTQKMSWSLVNKFPNHNFWWEGIDGESRVLTHFPPGDSYNMNGTVSEILRSQNNSLDKGRCNTGVYLYGYGDGGGGPTRQMIERLNRVKSTDGLPKIEFQDSNTFFDQLNTESDKFYKWVGELYLELHNGTYTSQALIKWFNRKCEFMLREVEHLMSIAYATEKAQDSIIREDLKTVDKCWQDVLLNQFHDVLPGSCIEFAAIDANNIYKALFETLIEVRNKYHTLLLQPAGEKKVIHNYLPWEVTTVLYFKPDQGDPPVGVNIQHVTLDATEFDQQQEGWFRVPNNFSAALVKLNPSGYTEFTDLQPTRPVSLVSTPERTLSNGLVTLKVSVTDNIPSEQLFFDGQNEIPAFNDYKNLGVIPGMFYYYDDIPMYWDAWDIMDYHLETRRLPAFDDGSISSEDFANGPIVGGYKWSATFNNSTITRYTILRADSPMIEYYTIVDWHEDRKLLKVEFPVDVLAREATYEIQYGNLKRNTHMNTSWDMAKYEVCGHKWMDISQADKGVAFITDSKYGWHVRDNHVQLSLLKSPKNPDANCDMGKHYIYYAVLPHKGTFQSSDVIQRAYELNTLVCNNTSILTSSLDAFPHSLVITDNPAVIVEAVKIRDYETSTRTLVVRLYEGHGGSAPNTKITMNSFDVTEVFQSNGLEVEGAPVEITDNSFLANFKPYQIQTFLLKF